MSRVLNYAPRVAIFLAGVAAAAITLPRHRSGGMDSATADELKRSLAGLEGRLQDRESADGGRAALRFPAWPPLGPAGAAGAGAGLARNPPCPPVLVRAVHLWASGSVIVVNADAS